MKNNSKLIVPGSKQAIDQMKYEIANQLGVNLGGDTTSKANGSVVAYYVEAKDNDKL